MPILDVSVRISQAEKEILERAAAVAADTETNKRKEKWKAQVHSERGRTIDQIKRLYAVIMGFAVTSCIANAYVSARRVPPLSFEIYSMLFAQVFSFVSLAALFYLGAERMLDRRYLQPNTGAPKWSTLLFDLGTLGLTATWLVVLANTFPTFPLSANAQAGSMPLVPETAIAKDFDYFIVNLGILYALDVVLLFLHGWNGWKSTEKEEKDRWEAYKKWIAINLVSLSLINIMFWLVPYHLTIPFVYLNLGACFLIGWHVVRFVLDFKSTFNFYYPAQDPNAPPEDFVPA